MPACFFNSSNRFPVTGLVSISAGFSSLDTQCTEISPSSTHSLTKWCLCRMCFVLRWKSRLYDRVDAPLLSVQTLGMTGLFRNSMTFAIHIASCAPAPRAMYSASVDDRVVTSCFRAAQDIGESPRSTSMPVVAFSSSFSSPASVKISISIFLTLLRCIPSSAVPSKYAITRHPFLTSDTLG